MAKNRVIEIKGVPITISVVNDRDYISLTDMTKGFEDGSSAIERWLRAKDTIEFIGVWEVYNNPLFNSPEFEGIRNEAGTNRFSLSVKKWIEKTQAVGIMARTGRYGSGTFAHKDIAFEFGTWLSPEFKYLLIKEFDRLKDEENVRLGTQWDAGRYLSKINYHLQADSIKNHLLTDMNVPKNLEGVVYADEADLLNLIVFGITSKDWRLQNPEEAQKGRNMRDFADLHQLTVLANLESYNAILIKYGMDKNDRITELHHIAQHQLQTLQRLNIAPDKMKLSLNSPK